MDNNIVLQLIENNGLISQDVDTIVTTLNAKSILRQDEEFKTIKTIISRYGVEFATIALSGLKTASINNPLLEAIYISLCSTGISFADPLTQGMIDQLTLAGIWDSETANKLKSIGIWYISPVESILGVNSTITYENVNNALNVKSNIELMNKIASKYNNIIAGIDSGIITSWEDAKTAFIAD